MTPDSIRIGIIGLGHVGTYHVMALQQFPDVRLIAGCDLQASMQHLLPAGTVFCNEPDALLAQSSIDTVIIATPNETHEELARAAFAAGKHVIMEKPAATSVEGFDDVDRLFCDAKEQHIYYAFHSAYAREVSYFRDCYQQPSMRERLGPITGFACHFFDPYVIGGEIQQQAASLGDSWVDSGVNALSVVAEFVDLNALNAVASASTELPIAGIPIQTCMQYRFGTRTPHKVTDGASSYLERTGGLGIINTNWTVGLDQKRTWLFFGHTGHEILLDHSLQTIVELDRDGCERVLACGGGKPRLFNHYVGVIADYLNCRRRGEFDRSRARRIHELLYQRD